MEVLRGRLYSDSCAGASADSWLDKSFPGTNIGYRRRDPGYAGKLKQVHGTPKLNSEISSLPAVLECYLYVSAGLIRITSFFARTLPRLESSNAFCTLSRPSRIWYG